MPVKKCFDKYMKSVLRECSYQIKRKKKPYASTANPRAVLQVESLQLLKQNAHRDPYQDTVRACANPISFPFT